jgi:hypothetical protein
MHTVARKARPRRRPDRVALVNLDGTPARPIEPDAAGWPAWTDNFSWECGATARELPDHVTHEPFEPDDDDRRDGVALWAEMMIESGLPPVETDAEFLARLGREESAELSRVMASYQPLPGDLEEYAAWSAALDDGTLPPESASRFSLGSFRRIAAIASTGNVD